MFRFTGDIVLLTEGESDLKDNRKFVVVRHGGKRNESTSDGSRS